MHPRPLQHTMRALVVLTVLLCATHAVAFGSTNAQTLPAPWDSDAGSAVSDPDRLLSSKYRALIEQELRLLRGDGEGCAGFRVVVVVVRRMAFDGNTLERRAENFARSLFGRWRVDGSCGNGVLLLVSVADKRMFIVTGEKVKGTLTEGRIDGVYASMVPYLMKGKLSKAVRAGVENIARVLGVRGIRADTHKKGKRGIGSHAWWWSGLTVTSVIALVMVGLACCNGVGGTAATAKKKRAKEVMSKLALIKQEYDSASLMPRYVPASCPVCVKDLVPEWVPTVPTLPDDAAAETNASETAETALLDPRALRVESTTAETRASVRSLRCGHRFHEACLPSPAVGEPPTTCPVCDDRAGGTSTPPSLKDSREKDFLYRVQRVSEQYPDVITSEVVAKLSSQPLGVWSEQGVLNPESSSGPHFGARQQQYYQAPSQGPGWGGVAAAGGLGALAGWALSGFGRRRHQPTFYDDGAGLATGGHAGQWSNSSNWLGNGEGGGDGGILGSGSNTGGHGAGWGNIAGSWGGGGSHASTGWGGGGGGWGGGGGGWGGGGGSWGGGGGGGHGGGW